MCILDSIKRKLVVLKNVLAFGGIFGICVIFGSYLKFTISRNADTDCCFICMDAVCPVLVTHFGNPMLSRHEWCLAFGMCGFLPQKIYSVARFLTHIFLENPLSRWHVWKSSELTCRNSNNCKGLSSYALWQPLRNTRFVFKSYSNLQLFVINQNL
jgi:hypothetical protein